MFTMRDFMIIDERRKDVDREAQADRLASKNVSPVQIKLQRLLGQFAEAMETRFKEDRTKTADGKPAVGKLAPKQG